MPSNCAAANHVTHQCIILGANLASISSGAKPIEMVYFVVICKVNITFCVVDCSIGIAVQQFHKSLGVIASRVSGYTSYTPSLDMRFGPALSSVVELVHSGGLFCESHLADWFLPSANGSLRRPGAIWSHSTLEISQTKPLILLSSGNAIEDSDVSVPGATSTASASGGISIGGHRAERDG
ncbi:hypothetical protein FIBSPDRAFT_904424 [Athelia psychrophila]|uniref:Uncharacterized protein n=1 Tax=Athelia psychrophila TaxID=1759441 RepID=A0A167USG1_9AGAM|nr:hypothetical protein FIBSPDRAFT_904424 [Fibularhizoctonia sp. CBS 109695]